MKQSKNNIKCISVGIEVEAPIEIVFNTVTNWEEQEKWVFLTKVRGVDGNSQMLGGKLEAYTGVGRVGFFDTMTITEWQQNKICGVTHTGSVVKGKGIFEVSVKNSSTYFTWTEYIELPFSYIGKAGWVLVKPLAKLGLWLSIRRLKKYIEKSR